MNNAFLIYIRFSFLAILRRHESQEELETDSIPVSSNGDGVEKYNGEDKIPKKVKEEGNSAQGTGTGF